MDSEKTLSYFINESEKLVHKKFKKKLELHYYLAIRLMG